MFQQASLFDDDGVAGLGWAHGQAPRPEQDRMREAFRLAAQCWGRAYRVAPEFVERYLTLCAELLMCQRFVEGDTFRSHCSKRGLLRDIRLHHNVWVSGVGALKHIGWIKHSRRVTPQHRHNHMEIVTLWESMIYRPDLNANVNLSIDASVN
jgi:hypothetical protein